jgi:hypothetical protein
MGAFFLFISLFAVAVILFEAVGYTAYKATGIEWTKVTAQTVDRDSISASPLPPPSGVLFYMDPLFSDKLPSQKEDEK